jgi:hypothetical protein
VNTEQSAVAAIVSSVAIIQEGARTWTTVSMGTEVEDHAVDRAVYFDVVDSRPRASDRVGTALYSLAQNLRTIEPVRALTYATEGDVHLVWSFIRRRDKEIRRRIYTEEHRLMATFPDLTFDFNVVALDSVGSRPLLPDDVQGQLVYYRGER